MTIASQPLTVEDKLRPEWYIYDSFCITIQLAWNIPAQSSSANMDRFHFNISCNIDLQEKSCYSLNYLQWSLYMCLHKDTVRN